MSTELHTLSGAYALNALSAEEAVLFRRHLEQCAACRQEVGEFRQAAAEIGEAEAVVPPAELRRRVLAAADRTPQQPPLSTGGTLGSNVTALPRRWVTRLLVAAAAAVLVAAGAVGISQLQDDDERHGTLLAQEVVQVFEADDANTATMETTNGGRISVATSPSRGKMAVDTDELPALEDDQVYQLWAVRGDEATSMGILQPERGVAMELPSPDIEVAITIEPAGGSDQPTTAPIMRVNPSEV
jgi:anti-sigma-K factor RskA